MLPPDARTLEATRSLLLDPPGGRSLGGLLGALCAVLAQARDLPDPCPLRVAEVVAELPPWAADLPVPPLPRLTPGEMASLLRSLLVALDSAARGQGWWLAAGWPVELLTVALDELAFAERRAA